MDAREFEDANAACGLLPGPASTQLAIFCAYRVGGRRGRDRRRARLHRARRRGDPRCSRSSSSPTRRRCGSAAPGAGAGAAVAAVAVHAARGLLGPSFTRVARGSRARGALGAPTSSPATAAAALIGPYLVLVLLACGLLELALQRRPASSRHSTGARLAALLAGARAGALGALAWTAFKVGALSFGGGFVIIPLMQGDAVHTYHWMSNAQFLNAVALGQITPGPVVATVAAVGYAAHGLLGGVLAALVAFTPSFSFILLGGGRFERLRANANARAFLDGAGPAAIGAILGAAITLARALSRGLAVRPAGRRRGRTARWRAAASSRRCSPRARSASSPRSPAVRCRNRADAASGSDARTRGTPAPHRTILLRASAGAHWRTATRSTPPSRRSARR